MAAVKKIQVKKLDVVETKMHRWMCGVTKMEQKQNKKRDHKSNWSVKLNTGKKTAVVWACEEKRRGVCGEESDRDGGTGTQDQKVNQSRDGWSV